MDEPRTYVQWKGTDLCMDLRCACGHHSHIDGYFAYHVMCPDCGTVYKMPENLPLERIDRGALTDDDLVHMDTRQPIVRDGRKVGSIGGDDIAKPWRTVRQITPYAAARAAEHS